MNEELMKALAQLGGGPGCGHSREDPIKQLRQRSLDLQIRLQEHYEGEADGEESGVAVLTDFQIGRLIEFIVIEEGYAAQKLRGSILDHVNDAKKWAFIAGIAKCPGHYSIGYGWIPGTAVMSWHYSGKTDGPGEAGKASQLKPFKDAGLLTAYLTDEDISLITNAILDQTVNGVPPSDTVQEAIAGRLFTGGELSVKPGGHTASLMFRRLDASMHVIWSVFAPKGPHANN